MTFDTYLSLWIILLVVAVYSFFKGSNFLYGAAIVGVVALVLSPSIEAEEVGNHIEESTLDNNRRIYNGKVPTEGLIFLYTNENICVWGSLT